MASITSAYYGIKKLDERVTVTIYISTEFKIRKYIAIKLIKLATVILGCRLVVQDEI